MFVKIFIIIVMMIILSALASGLIFLVRDAGNSRRTVQALTWRIGLSLGLFIFLFIAFGTGMLNPHALL